ncbi:SDR family NAD(P)-dependent oxidoreductase [Amycolatopsis sp. GM8]|uniref:SDR family NAD(P)-dependent oxidoreductase n=1 Tax=Amycolatopsis sp. GM8 TaxID=2896530 RepID=UPI001F3DC075|nr:SDR family oxidoreductase [Amycolatopsis sp. GM8]
MTTIAPGHGGLPLAALLDLSGRIAVVTGAASGIGRACAARLAEAGATVYRADIAHRRQPVPPDPRQIPVDLDVTDPGAVSALFARVHDDHGRLDILVNSAGVFPRAGLLDISLREWRRVHAINVEGALLCTQEAARLMAGHRHGVVVNISSTVTDRVNGNAAHYRASKTALLSLTQSLAAELGPQGVRAVAVCPTLTRTEGVAALASGGEATGLDKFGARLPLGRAAEPDDVARAVLFAVSPMAGFVTGSAIYVDGGELAR